MSTQMILFFAPAFLLASFLVLYAISSIIASVVCIILAPLNVWFQLAFLPAISIVTCFLLTFLDSEMKVTQFYAEYNCRCGKAWRVGSDYNNQLARCPRCGHRQLPSSKTSYHGRERVFGKFKCSVCHRTWASNISWAETAQKCLNCGAGTYPYKQTPVEELTRGEMNSCNPAIHHQTDCCDRCQHLGYDCSIGPSASLTLRSR